MIRKTGILFVFFTAIFATAFAQKITVYEVNESFKNGVAPAYTVDIYENSLDEVRSAWKKNMNNYKADKLAGKKQITAEKVRMPSLSPNPVHVYAITEELGYRHVKLTVAFMVDSLFLNKSKPAENDIAKKFVQDFALQTTKNGIIRQQKKEQKAFEKLGRAQQSLVEDSISLKKDIVDYQNRIKKAENDLVKNKQKQESKKQEIEKQKAIIEELKLRLEKVQ